ncbi:MAG: DUF934 domain-containing protein [Pseudomonadota bacterium]
MSVIVTDTGFAPDDWTREVISADELSAETPPGVDLTSDANPKDLSERLSKIELIRVDFPKSADGRGFTIARKLRLMGYRGRLRAKGHVIADQYAMARRAGFDEVEIDKGLAQRQPQDQWLARASWREHDYQSRLRSAAFS